MPGPLFVEGDRISLHAVTDEDYEFLSEHRNRPAIRRGIGQATPTTEDDYREMVEEGEDSVAFLPCHAGQPVGYAWAFHLSDVSRNALIGYWIAEAEQGQGYGTEAVDLLCRWAFEDRGLHKLWAHVFAENTASQHVLESNGFDRVGTLSEQYWVDGEFVDAVVFERLAEDWRADA